MERRLKLHEELCTILGTRSVYFNPPESIKMSYPAIRYVPSAPDVKRANNGVYGITKQYEVTVIDPDPDSAIPDKILEHFKQCKWDSTYKADNLVHTVFTIYY